MLIGLSADVSPLSRYKVLHLRGLDNPNEFSGGIHLPYVQSGTGGHVGQVPWHTYCTVQYVPCLLSTPYPASMGRTRPFEYRSDRHACTTLQRLRLLSLVRCGFVIIIVLDSSNTNPFSHFFQDTTVAFRK